MKNYARSLFRAPALLAILILNLQLANVFAQGTAFTYQGQLQNNGSLASGTYNLQFTLYTNATGGTSVAGPVTNSAVFITNGLFTVTMDFGSGPWNGQANWLLIGVETNGGAGFSPLSPRQPVTPVPYAIAAENLSGTVSGAGLAGTYGSQVSFTNPANQFTGSGSSLTGLNASQLTTGTVPSAALNNAWKTTGNSGTAPGANFVGTGDNQPLEFRVNNQRGLRLEPAGSNSVNVIGGWVGNSVGSGAVGATISGGGAGNYFTLVWSNQVSSDFGTVAGGTVNSIQWGARYANISGGWNNTIQSNAYSSAVGGGENNTIQAGVYESTIAGGFLNVLEGGDVNTIGGGDYNTIEPGIYNAVISGGHGNLIQSNSWYATVAGGSGNNIQTNDLYSTIGGGGGNLIQTGSGSAAIAGGLGNMILANSGFTVIGGGYANIIDNTAVECTIAGGRQNTIGTNAPDAVIGGGLLNTILILGGGSVIAGGYDNLVQPGADLINGECATISGGLSNSVSGFETTIGGGVLNTASAAYAAVGGGSGNAASGGNATIGGGSGNTASSFADTVAGGGNNTASSPDGSATVGGGYENTASGDSSTVPGGFLNIASGGYSFAAGQNTRATHSGSFVWGDGTAITSDSNNNQFVARASGGFYFYSSSGNTGMELPAGSGMWSPLSDRNAKENFQTVNAEAILSKVTSLPVTTWNYKAQAKSIRHIGPMAQDFHAEFGMGEDERHIGELDESGVALVAIQGLNKKLESDNAELKQENSLLAKRLDELEAQVKVLAGKKQ
jgi:hypothetical protein